MRKTLLKYFLFLGTVFLIIFIFRKTDILPSFKDIFRSRPVLIEETPVVIKEIKSLAQLITITYADEIVMTQTKKGNGLPSLVTTGPGVIMVPATDKLVIIGRGKAIAGIDLKSVGEKDIHVEGDSISLRLPPAQILNTIINPSGYEIFIEQGKWEESQIIRLKQLIKKELFQRAIDQNVLKLSETRAINIFENLLLNMGYQKVYVFIGS
ncbi:hypothetical protein BH20BAC1_BH20BAC1_26670 [soil metagenome]